MTDKIKLAWVNPAPLDPMLMSDEELEWHFRRHDMPLLVVEPLISENDKRSLNRWFPVGDSPAKGTQMIAEIVVPICIISLGAVIMWLVVWGTS